MKWALGPMAVAEVGPLLGTFSGCIIMDAVG